MQDSPGDPWTVTAIPAAPLRTAFLLEHPHGEQQGQERGGEKREYLGVLSLESRGIAACVCGVHKCVCIMSW